MDVKATGKFCAGGSVDACQVVVMVVMVIVVEMVIKVVMVIMLIGVLW